MEYATDDPNKITRFRDAGYYVWDIKKGTVQRDTSLGGASKICVHGDYWSYIRRSKVDEKDFVLVSGKKGDETERPYPKVHWFNPHSCRYYDTKPFWVVEGHQTIPLLEEHGYLDLGSVSPPQPDPLTLRFENPNPAISFYSVAAKKSFALPIGWLESRILQVHYAPFSNTYLLSGLQYYDEQRGFLSDWPQDSPHKVWWLSPDGTVKKEELPNVPALQGGWPGMLPIRNGLFVLAGYSKNMSDPGTSGGFVVRDQNVQKVVIGGLRRAAVSADGCRVAVVNDTYEKKPVAERLRLQLIQLCQGE